MTWTTELNALAKDFMQAYPLGRKAPAATRQKFLEAVGVISERFPPGRDGWEAAGAWLVERGQVFAKSWAGQRGQFTPGAVRWLSEGWYDAPDSQWEDPGEGSPEAAAMARRTARRQA